jgi:tetratricopeptide (TPR) repeat protein
MNLFQAKFFSNVVQRAIRQAAAARDLKSWRKAAALYEEAVAADPDLAGIWVQLGHCRKESGQLASAEVAYRRSLQIDDKVADTHLQLGHVLKPGQIAIGQGQLRAGCRAGSRLGRRSRRSRRDQRADGRDRYGRRPETGLRLQRSHSIFQRQSPADRRPAGSDQRCDWRLGRCGARADLPCRFLFPRDERLAFDQRAGLPRPDSRRNTDFRL